MTESRISSEPAALEDIAHACATSQVVGFAEARTVVLYASELDEEEGYRPAESVFEISVEQLSAVASEGRSNHGRK